MNTVQKNNTITKNEFQVFLEKNQKKLGFSDENLKNIIKGLRKKKITKEKLLQFYLLCVKKIENNIVNQKNKHLTLEEREIIEVMYELGFKQIFIAEFIGKYRSTISRELNKNIEEVEDLQSTVSYKKANAYKKIKIYNSKKAHKKYLKNKSRSRKKAILEKNPNLRKAIIGLLRDSRETSQNGSKIKIKNSPEIIAELSKKQKIKGVTVRISKSTIYNNARSRKYGFTVNDLPYGRHYYKPDKKGKGRKEISERKKEYSIEKLPDEVKKKESTTHFEGDSIIGKAKGNNNTLITLVNTYSRFTFIERAKNKTAKSFVEVLDALEEEIIDFRKIFDTLLLDNGCEFSDIEGIMKSCKDGETKRLSVYYAHPYASCERGCNENKNRQVREDFPKSTLVETLTDEDILNIAIRINNTPRKILNYRTSLEVFEEELKSKNINTDFLDKYRIKKSKYLVA